MNIGKFQRALALLTTCVFLATGCASMRTVPLGQAGVAPDVQVGQSVVVTTKDGAKHKFQVTALEKDGLRGDHDRIAYADMQSLAVQNPADRTRTALIIGAVVLGAVAIGAASGGGGGGGY